LIYLILAVVTGQQDISFPEMWHCLTTGC